jgi:hypothetical protein
LTLEIHSPILVTKRVKVEVSMKARSCISCLLSSAVEGIHVDEKRLCDYCAGRKPEDWIARFGVTEERKKALRGEFEDMLAAARGKGTHDCVLGVSGGKDSAYLLYDLSVNRKLKVLGVHVRTPFESEVAEQNVRRLRDRIPFDYHEVDPGRDFFARMYRALFLHPFREGYMKSVCYVCGPLLMSLAVEAAVERRIPLVIMGYSPHQPETMFFEWDRMSLAQRSWVPELFRGEDFDDRFRGMFWDPRKCPPATPLPRVIAPLHVLDYRVEHVMDVLSKNDIVPKKRLNPVATNCALNWAFIYLDTKLLGHNPYIREFSSMVRQGHTRRAVWKTLVVVIDKLVRLNLFKRRDIGLVEKTLGIKLSQCPTESSRVEKAWAAYP